MGFDNDLFTIGCPAELTILDPDQEWIFKEQNIDPFECTIIDDQKKNLISASELGFKTIHVKINEDLIDFKPDLEIKSLNELITHFHH